MPPRGLKISTLPGPKRQSAVPRNALVGSCPVLIQPVLKRRYAAL
jgi:hypothetical protein